MQWQSKAFASGCWDGLRLWLCANLCAFLPQGMISSWLQSTSWGMHWVWNTPMIPVLSWLLSTSTWKHTTSNCPRMTSKEFRKSMVSNPTYFFTYTTFEPREYFTISPCMPADVGLHFLSQLSGELFKALDPGLSTRCLHKSR